MENIENSSSRKQLSAMYMRCRKSLILDITWLHTFGTQSHPAWLGALEFELIIKPADHFTELMVQESTCFIKSTCTNVTRICDQICAVIEIKLRGFFYKISIWCSIKGAKRDSSDLQQRPQSYHLYRQHQAISITFNVTTDCSSRYFELRKRC